MTIVPLGFLAFPGGRLAVDLSPVPRQPRLAFPPLSTILLRTREGPLARVNHLVLQEGLFERHLLAAVLARVL